MNFLIEIISCMADIAGDSFYDILNAAYKDKTHKCYSHSSAPSDKERLKRNRRDAFKRH